MNRYLFAARNFYDKLVKVAGDWETLHFYVRTYVLAHFETVTPDTYFVSYPKCGRTWLRIMLQKYLEYRHISVRHFNDRSLLEIAGNHIIKFEHDQGSWIPTPPRIDHLRFDAEKYSNARVIFLVRDPRDVLVSSWYHLTYRERIYQDGLSAFVRDDLVGIRKIVAYMNLWMENRDVPADFLLLTYEGLHANPHESFQKLLHFIDIPVNMDDVAEAVEASSFENMKRMEKAGTLKEPWMKPGAKDRDKSLKVRKGKVGSFEEELSQRDIDFVNRVIRESLSPELPYFARISNEVAANSG